MRPATVGDYISSTRFRESFTHRLHQFRSEYHGFACFVLWMSAHRSVTADWHTPGQVAGTVITGIKRTEGSHPVSTYPAEMPQQFPWPRTHHRDFCRCSFSPGT